MYTAIDAHTNIWHIEAKVSARAEAKAPLCPRSVHAVSFVPFLSHLLAFLPLNSIFPFCVPAQAASCFPLLACCAFLTTFCLFLVFSSHWLPSAFM